MTPTQKAKAAKYDKLAKSVRELLHRLEREGYPVRRMAQAVRVRELLEGE